jgi:O-methyltransferase
MPLWLKQALVPLFYRHPVPELSAERLYLYFDAMARTRARPGGVVEIGCFRCGTSAWAYRMLKALGVARPYLCVDTFGGFVEAQFSDDVAAGTIRSHRRGFSANSREFVQRLLEQWDVAGIALIQGDIVTLPATRLPDQIAVALIDVDLDAPTYAALEKVYPRLVAGGSILVDDCSDAPSNPFRGARIGYERFVRQHHLPEHYEFGMGRIDRPVE